MERPMLAVPWPKTFHLYVVCHGKLIEPTVHRLHGELAPLWVVLGRFWPVLAVWPPQRSGKVATDGSLRGVWGPNLAGSMVFCRGTDDHPTKFGGCPDRDIELVPTWGLLVAR